MKITVAKGLKLKNRIVAKIGEVSSQITEYNSIIEGAERPVDVSELMNKRERLVDVLINLKNAINNANLPIQQTIYLLAELKGEVAFLKSINTTSGKNVQEYSWRETEVVHIREAILDYQTVHGLITEAQVSIDSNQDKIDKHNHTVEIDVDEEVLELIRS